MGNAAKVTEFAGYSFTAACARRAAGAIGGADDLGAGPRCVRRSLPNSSNGRTPAGAIKPASHTVHRHPAGWWSPIGR